MINRHLLSKKSKEYAGMQVLETLRQIKGVGDVGCCDFRVLAHHCTPEQTVLIHKQVSNPACVLVALFPYHATPVPSNLSRYAQGQDYHTVITQALTPFVAELQQAYPAHTFRILVDASPLPEVIVAALCGLGCIGDNRLLLHHFFGSEVFIGTILTDLPLPTHTVALQGCLHCGACAKACPVGLSEENCLSRLTQHKGDFTQKQQDLLRQHPLIWGCDSCQICCPMNQHLPTSDNPAFVENRITTLTLDDVAGLTRKQLLAKYPNRAFTWRGAMPLERNLQHWNG